MDYRLDRRLAAITVADNEQDITPLHRAAQNGPADAITAMLDGLSADQRLAAITVLDMFGNTPLQWVAYNGPVNAITAMLAGLNVAQCRDALFNLEYGVGTKLAQEYAKNPQHADAQRYLNTLIKGVAALETSDGTDEQGLSENDKKGLITGIIQEVEKINSDAEIPSAAVPYLDIPKTVGGYLQGLQGSFAQAVTATTAVPTNTPEATIGNAGGYRCPVKRGFDGNPVSRRNYPGCDR
jgi:ankyrin repeat protein